jgi:hypothetical protein
LSSELAENQRLIIPKVFGLFKACEWEIFNGAKKEKIKTAQNLLDMGIDIEKISRATGLRKNRRKMLNAQLYFLNALL